MQVSQSFVGNTGSKTQLSGYSSKPLHPCLPFSLSVPRYLNLETDLRVWNLHLGHEDGHILRMGQRCWPVKCSINGPWRIRKHSYITTCPPRLPTPKLPSLLVVFSRSACPCREWSGQVPSQLLHQIACICSLLYMM